MIDHLTDEDLLARIRSKLASGRLPWEGPRQILGGPSQGVPCAACDEKIAAASAEIEVVSADGQQRPYHPRCYNLLRAERERPRGSSG